MPVSSTLPPGPSRRSLLALTLVVVGAHAVLLWGAPTLLPLGEGPSGQQPSHVRPFSTRRIESTPIRPKAPPLPPARRKPWPQPAAAPPAQTATTDPLIETDSPEPALEAAPAASALVPPPGDAPSPPTGPEAPAAVSAGPDAGPATKVAAADTPAASDTHALSVRVPPPMRLAYTVRAEVRHLPYQANGEMSWTHDGSHYEAKASISVFLIGSRTQTSQGDITAAGLAPRRFGDKARSEQAAHFDPDQGKVSFSANTPDVVLLPGMQDRLSLFMQLAALVAADPTQFPSGTHITVPTVSARDADTWVFNVDGLEDLNLSTGTVSTLKLTRAPRAEHDTQVEIWMAPSLHYLPARIRITQANGDYVDQQLHEVLPP